MLGTNPSLARVSANQPAKSLPRLGNWQIVSRLGAGRWSLVFRAKPADSDQAAADYVVKTIKPKYAEQEIAIRQLQREHQVCREVSDRHLSSVLAVELDSAPYHLVMPYIAGVSADRVLSATGQLKLPHALWIVRQTSQALQALHDAGWRHADVKPQNILVTKSGHATLLDLGLASRLDGSHAIPPVYAATPVYAAPEVGSRSVAPSAASDVFSLGVTFFELLTGRLPDTGAAGRPTDCSQDRFVSVRCLRRLRNDLHPGVGHLLNRMLAQEPIRRPSAAELVCELSHWEIETLAERAFPAPSLSPAG